MHAEVGQHREQPEPSWRRAIRQSIPQLPLALAVAVAAAVMVSEGLTFGLRLVAWDWLLISGLVAFSAGSVLVQGLPTRFEQMLLRLEHRGVLTSEAAAGARLVIQQRVTWWGHLAGLAVSAALIVAFIAAQASPGLLVLEAALGYVAGCYLGRMVAYGSLGQVLQRQGNTLRVQVGHIDHAAGLKPTGDYYFYQASIAAIPALFLAVWIVLIPLWPHRGYDEWYQPYLGLLTLAVAFEMLSFLAPLWSFHHQMVEQKCMLLARADSLSCEMLDLQAEVSRLNEAERKARMAQLSVLEAEYREIEQTPTWPVDLTTWRRFVAGTGALLTPLVSDVLLEAIKRALPTRAA
ncbi:MAG: hypothetical protein AB7P40_02945 [Chloroflexota bacterium]